MHGGDCWSAAVAACYAAAGHTMLEPAMLWKGMWLDIFWASPREWPLSCSWMYRMKLSEHQRPCFLMVSKEIPLRCMAIAPPAHKEWLLTSCWGYYSR